MEVVLNLIVQSNLLELLQKLQRVLLFQFHPAFFGHRRKLLLFGRLVLGCGQERGGRAVAFVLSRMTVFDSSLIIWVQSRKSFHQVSLLNLGPTKVTLVKFLFVVGSPPESVLEQSADHD